MEKAFSNRESSLNTKSSSLTSSSATRDQRLISLKCEIISFSIYIESIAFHIDPFSYLIAAFMLWYAIKMGLEGLSLDKFDTETRSKIMSSIRARSKLEAELCKALWRKGARFRTNAKNLFGKPDISIRKYKLAVFEDSCFWQLSPCMRHYRNPTSIIGQANFGKIRRGILLSTNTMIATDGEY